MKLLSSYRLGRLSLPNRIVMAPMTRSRAEGGVPNRLMADYYAQRASAGLIVTEGTAPSPNGLGYARIPGLFSSDQVAGWTVVTEAVHAAGGRIVAQLMHTGRIGHPANLPPGARLIAPSAVQANGTIHTDPLGPQVLPAPAAMNETDLRTTLDEFVQAARAAMTAGFDAVELHGANGYLLEQFLHPHSNVRSDAYGGSIDRRNRFVIDVAEATAAAIGAERVGLRLSPHNTFNDLPASDGVAEQYAALARSLRGLLYLHVIRSKHQAFPETLRTVREAFGGPLILNGGFSGEGAEVELGRGSADLVSFGSSFIANPDLVQRLRNGTPLSAADPKTFYTPGPAGYVDYPVAS